VVTKKVALRATLPHLGRTEQNRMFIGVKSIYKGLLPKQNIKYKTKKLLTTIKLHIHVWNACLINDIWYSINTWVVCVHLVFYQHMGCVCTFSILSTHGLCVYIWYSISTWVVCVHLVFYQHMGCVCTFGILSTHGLCVYIWYSINTWVVCVHFHRVCA
jgi:hypothetical protein